MQHCLGAWDIIYPPAQVRPVAADGNCQFRALAWAMYGSDARHRDVRAAVCDYMHVNIKHFIKFIGQNF